MWWGAQPPAWLDCKGSPCSGSINNHMQEEAEREQLYPNLLDPHRIKNLVVRPQPSLQRMGRDDITCPSSCSLCQQHPMQSCIHDHAVHASPPQGVKIAFIASGPSAVHCLAGDTEGRLYTWGRNEVRG